MKRLRSILSKGLIGSLLVIWSASLPAQTLLKGRVTDKNTDRPVSGASVYFDGTSTGTVSDSSGNFTIRLLPNNSIPLIVSTMGYYSLSVTGYDPGSVLSVKLQPRVFQLREVSLAFDGMSDEEKERIFKREFIGTPGEIRASPIQNMDDVVLEYKKAKRTLQGWSDRALVIKNSQLGYTIKYSLATFEASALRTFFQGYQLFEEDRSIPASKRKEILERRQKAYLGSTMHFIRSLWRDSLKEEGFKVLNSRGKELLASDIVMEKEGRKFIRLAQPIQIEYRKRTTWLYPKTAGATSEIDRQGYFNPVGVVWRGEMGKHRVAAMLPFDYSPVLKD